MIFTRANLAIVMMAATFALVGGRSSSADEVPTYNLSPSCRAETATAASDKSCMKDEQAARDSAEAVVRVRTNRPHDLRESRRQAGPRVT